MQIQVGYEIVYQFSQQTPMILMVNVHYSHAADIVVPDRLTTDPPVPITAHRDIYGNWCSRIVAPAGRIRLSANAIVNVTGELDAVVPSAPQHDVRDLPEDTLVFLLGSRYCETDLLSQVAWNLFSTPLRDGRGYRLSAIMSITISSLITRMPGLPRPLGRLSTSAKESAGIMLTWPSHSAAA